MKRYKILSAAEPKRGRGTRRIPFELVIDYALEAGLQLQGGVAYEGDRGKQAVVGSQEEFEAFEGLIEKAFKMPQEELQRTNPYVSKDWYFA